MISSTQFNSITSISQKHNVFSYENRKKEANSFICLLLNPIDIQEAVSSLISVGALRSSYTSPFPPPNSIIFHFATIPASDVASRVGSTGTPSKTNTAETINDPNVISIPKSITVIEAIKTLI
ncbi:hypothetical protein K502DRAFT_347705 [Neoconidiobolus thromboides FSU 785]|nr:hypothetical protein K502DRAFT_347705 [Neoconidiobolus thromboides FSU 785]